MLRASAARINFFPLGLRAGPKGQAFLLDRSNHHKFSMSTIPALKTDGKPNPAVKPRNQMVIKCSSCKFSWAQDKLVIRCTAHKDHYQQEAWLDTKWMYKINYANNFYRFIGKSVHPRTGQHINTEATKSRNNQRRGMMGLSTRALTLEKEKRMVSAHVSGVGAFSSQWKTKFPYPT
eukprot:TRINITY_DN47636_c0_g1_i1.p1 TRINITY_DN47636_c0_g1~~TRINITY_DN47636_c0_g1_i1.p1  ORF type:complete len:177 (+),score=12.46 TRINITY_DN47636_c0_g1_i1:219-749(+)